MQLRSNLDTRLNLSTEGDHLWQNVLTRNASRYWYNTIVLCAAVTRSSENRGDFGRRDRADGMEPTERSTTHVDWTSVWCTVLHQHG